MAPAKQLRINPQSALAEIWRCLRPGGLAAVCAPSRYNDPEFGRVLPRWGKPLSFDAENGPTQVATVFGDVDVEAWDEPANEKTMLLYAPHVAEGHRGQGWGKALVAAFVEHASSRGCTEVWTLTDRDNDRAVATYTSAGGSAQSGGQVCSRGGWPRGGTT